MMSGPQSFGFVSGQKNFTTNKTGGAFKTPPVVSPAFYGQANLVPLRHDNLVSLSAYRYYLHGFAGHVDNVALALVQQPAARVVNRNGIVLLFARDGYPAVSGENSYLARFNV